MDFATREEKWQARASLRNIFLNKGRNYKHRLILICFED
jgi:hypothetical protein